MKKILVILMATVMCFSFAACGSTQQAAEGTLTVKGDGFEKAYTAEELLALGADTVTYSGRTKKVENERVFQDKTGVDLKEVLLDAGAIDVDDAILKVVANDGYESEYEVADLYDGKVAFESNDSDKCSEVGAMIAVNEEEGDYPSPFQIVFGQATYDKCDNSAQDFNMQKWGSYLETIEVSSK